MWVQKVTGAGIDGVAFAPDGRTLYTGDGLDRFVAWDVATRTATPLARIAPGERLGLYRLLATPDGRFLVAVQPGHTFAYDVASGKLHARTWVNWPKDARLAPGGAAVTSLATLRRQQWTWDVAAGTEGQTPFPGRPADGPLVRAFDLSPDGRTLAVAGDDGQIALIDTGTGQERARIVRRGFEFSFSHLRFSPDGNTLLLFTQHQLVLWDVPRGAVRAEARPAVPFGATFAISPAHPIFATLNAEQVLTLYSLDTGKPLRSLDFMLGRYVRCLAFAPDGLTCAVGGSNKQFAVFDVDV